LTQSKPDWKSFAAVLFDLDGVLTATAKIHAVCWKRMFDAYLMRYAEQHNCSFQPFDITSDYLAHVDGKLRYDGVRSFLASRGIELPEGSDGDPPEAETVRGLGNRKDAMVGDVLAREGVGVFEGSIELVHYLRAAGVKTAVVSASKNCQAVLEAADIVELFDVRVDGVVAARLKLPGKPAPDTFLEAARELGVDPALCIVIEDALSGVEAGRRGNFGLVIGIDRHGEREALLNHGADIVVTDLSELLPE